MIPIAIARSSIRRRPRAEPEGDAPEEEGQDPDPRRDSPKSSVTSCAVSSFSAGSTVDHAGVFGQAVGQVPEEVEALAELQARADAG